MQMQSLIAEITSGGFTQYEEAGLIDHISLRTWIKNELKRFGGNITTRNELILHVKNGRAKLPDNFWQLYLAVQCEIKDYECNDPKKVLQNSFFYKERVEGINEWNNESETFDSTTHKYVREEYYFQGAHATFYYGNPRLLNLVKGFNKSVCNSQCPNLRRAIVGSNPNEININQDYLTANFKEGTIYMMYDGFAKDEDGEIIIPETQHNRLQEYLTYYCRMRILEEIWTGSEDDVANKLSYFDQKQRIAFALAMTEIKMESLGKDWKRKLRNKMRAQTLKYDLMLPTR